jgi:hypothetical protein
MEITYVFFIIIINCIIISNIYASFNNNYIDHNNRDNNNNEIKDHNNNDSINSITTIEPTTTITTMMMVNHKDNNHNHGKHINIINNPNNNNNMNINYTHYVKVFHYIIDHWGDSKKGIQICLTHNIVCDWYHSDNIKILRDNLVYHTQPYYPHHHHSHQHHQHHNYTYHHHNHRRITTQQLQNDHNITINNSLIINESLIHYPYHHHHSNQQQHHDNNHYHHHQLPMITLSLYNIHSWWEHTRNVLPASCDLHTNLTIFETEESKIRYQQLFEQSYQHYDGYSSTSPDSNIQRVYNEAYLKNSTFLKLNKYDMMIKGASYVASDCHKHDSVNCK